ncbi:glycosyltransferase family 9 protein [Leptospira noguchii]|uniref:glycosyltransferase family 9 protein n=1 Tax=Leptospira noguchii TaxID=28182 RepID=UPI001F0675EB|nr:glycosyltransferase family 9 protein [Leptospira noguchii]MCH1910901.1 glycosyltransferase family 9 protein [Leptospira noguchii]MCH1916955.1 glycosyltransferase family 9 protein [Leptospira noguchii]UOG62722.1 glycosyltransferase family 9 protein [Leptospira noguchii]
MNLLVMRFSAMGDVALMAPAIIAIAAKYTNIQLTIVTRGNYAPFFYNIPNVNVVGFNLKRYRGILGLYRLFLEINKLGPYEKVIDLHSSVRSRLISLLFSIRGIGVFRIVKGRKEKLRQIRQKKKILTPLPHTVDRYLKVFEHAGYPASARKGPWINVDPESKMFAKEFFESQNIQKKESLWIGFAPFAGHALKEWPREKSKILLKLLLDEFTGVKIFLFGSKEESKILLQWRQDLEESVKIVSGGKLGIRGELGIMERMDVMIGMDSSNVHIAALLKRPVIGIYGTTHPYSGFAPFGQEDSGVLQIDNLSCRPCSIYGNTTCYRKDFACMEWIQPEDVIKRIRVVYNINTLF